jgi:hypothetical protein
MTVMRFDTIGKVETSPGRRTMKIRAEHGKRANKGSRSLPILPTISELTVRIVSTRLYTKAQPSKWARPEG